VVRARPREEKVLPDDVDFRPILDTGVVELPRPNPSRP
jgi:hypothetical protein